MPGLDGGLVEHHLPIKQGFRPQTMGQEFQSQDQRQGERGGG
jgi:hypothetical protein